MGCVYGNDFIVVHHEGARLMAKRRVTDTATNFGSCATTPPATEIQVPIGMWKGGMYCIEIPALTHDKDAPTTKIWAHSQEEAETNVKKHLATAGRCGAVSLTNGTKPNPKFKKKKVHTMAVNL